MANSSLKIDVYLNLPILVSREADFYASATQTSPVAMLLVPDDGSAGLPLARRLLVLVPGTTTSHELAYRIWTLADAAELEVLFIGAAWEANEYYAMRRLLTTLAAATRDRRLRVDTRLIRDRNWLRAIRAIWRPGDLVICHNEQTITAWGFQRLPLAQALVVALKAPVYVLTGFYSEPVVDYPAFTRRLLRSLLPFLIIAGFFVLQVQIEQLPKNWDYYVLMMLSVIVEMGLLALWH